MISTENKAHTTQIFTNKQLPHVLIKRQLEARRQTVNGKLTCRWVEVKISLDR